MLMNIAICDDENQQTEYLKKIISCWADNTDHTVCIHTFESAESFSFTWSENKCFDILLLDIQMGGQSGIELAKTIRKQDENIVIIFVTGMPQYIEEGYEVSALHYLMKPIKENKLLEVLDKAITRLNKIEPSLILTSDGESIKLLQKDILYIEAFAHTVALYTMSDTYEIKKSISKMIDELDSNTFVRCHRSYIVGIRAISRIKKMDIILDNGKVVPLSRRMYNAVNKAFIRYFNGEI